MIFSRADYPHARHQERKNSIEKEIKDILSEGVEPLVALEKLKAPFKLDDSTLKLLRRDFVETRYLELKSVTETGTQYDCIYKEYVEDSQHGRLRVIDAEYLRNHSSYIPAGHEGKQNLTLDLT